MSSRPDVKPTTISYNDADSKNWQTKSNRVGADIEKGMIDARAHKQAPEPKAAPHSQPKILDPALQNKFENFAVSSNLKETQLKLVIAKETVNHYEKLLEIKTDSTMEAGKKKAALEKIIQGHEQLLQETLLATERAEKIARTIIHMMKQASLNNGTFPPALLQKSHILNAAVNQMKGPSTVDPQIEQLMGKMSHFDDEIFATEQRILIEGERYQKSVQEQQSLLKQQELLKTDRKTLQSKMEYAEHEKKLILEKQKELQQQPDPQKPAPKAAKKATHEMDEDDLWAAFEQEDQRRFDESESSELQKSKETYSQPKINQDGEIISSGETKAAPGIIFLTDEESAAYDQAVQQKKQTKVTTVNQFLLDLDEENQIKEEEEAAATMAGYKDTAADIATNITSHAARLGSMLKKEGGSSKESPSSQKKPRISLNVKVGLKKPSSASPAKVLSSLTSPRSNKPPKNSFLFTKKLIFPAKEYEILRVVSKYFSLFIFLFFFSFKAIFSFFFENLFLFFLFCIFKFSFIFFFC